MAHYAKLGINSKVIGVEVVADADCLYGSGVEDEEVGRQFLEHIHSWPLWKKTSYNTSSNQHKQGGTVFRGNYAGVGYEWDEANNIFWPKKPYPSWVKDITTASWKSPIGDAPSFTAEQISQNETATHSWDYFWNEEEQSWDLTNTLA